MSSPFIVGGQVLSHEGLSSSHIEQELTSNTEPLRKKSKRGFAVRRPNMQRSKKRLNMMVEWETSSEGSRSNTVHSNPDFCSGQELLPQQRNVSDCTNNFNTNFAFVEAESQMYFDLGEMNMACQYCGAILWYHERAQKAKNAISPDFSICCMKGKISLPYLQDAPTLLSNLLTNIDPRSGHFIDNIRSYNSMFAFTSIGGKVDGSVNNGQGPPQFVISGQNYHRIGSLLPAEGDNPKFAQLNIYDTRNEFENRLNHFSDSTGKCSLNSDLVVELMAMVDEFNVLAKSFRRVRDHVQEANSNQVALRLFRHRVNDPKTYNLPTVDEVAALIVEDFDTSDCGRDIILRTSSGNLQRIYDTHSSFLPLQYPLIFPYGEEGFSDEIGFDGINYDSSIYKRTTISLREWVAFRLQERQFECKRITLSRRLLQQLVVDCYSMIESQRLYYLRNNQETIRRDFLSGIEEAIHRGDTDPSMVGSRIVLPSSFTGGRRYMFNNCQDAMGICREYGYPDLFLTMTCNPKWPEIERHVSARCLSAYDRPDLACRVFRMKLDQLMKNLKKGKFFGQAISWNAMADPSHVWRETWSVLADGIVHALRRTHNNLEFDSVMQLSLKQHPWKIKVRVIAVWNVDHLDQAHGLRCMHMVLIDKEHVKIQASFHKYIPSKLNIIQGRVYVLSLFRVKRNMDSERVTNHGFKLLFNSRTRIVLDVDAFIPYYGWDFLDFGHVQSSWGNFNYLIDVAGLVKAASNVKLVVQNSGITKVMVVDLQDTRGTVRCILMGDIVDKFADYMASNWTVQPVMGLQFMAVYYVRGKVILQTLPHLTKMHIDPVFDNERGIGDRLLGIGNNQPIEYIGHRNCEHNILDDMLVVHPKKTIGQLLQTTEKSGIFVVHVGILAVIEEGGWWYPSCRCYTKLTVDNGVYHCGCCERTIGKMLPRFSIKLEVFDGFDSTVFLLQDSEAIQLMHSSCVEVVTSEGLPNAVKFPVHLKDMLVGKEILCKIRKSTGVTYKGVQIYEIIRISFDQYMLELFHADDVPKIPPPAGNMDGGSHHEDSSMIDVSQGNDIDEEESGESSSSVSHNSS
ncbi:uncharacterized protein LOC130741224 isoform X6 [Lotus japonicus]|uniref:uncharacterized protein LOC130741224 isoform X6 n=1 Tax=Lotus japonicus TaxID=34305 RepID=UPI002590A9BF|nr:uncharacterized protein LOC130741224 isoform X6 [Lotus japonicus]